MDNIELRCTKCKRFLNVKIVKEIITTLRCPNQACKHWNKIKIVTSQSDEQSIRYKFKETE